MKKKNDEIQEPEVEEITAETVNQQLVILQKTEASVVSMANNEFEGLQGTRASKATESDLRNTIKVAVIKAHIGLKRSFEKLEIRFVIDQLKDEILRSFPGIRLEEIQLAIHRGAMGNNGKVYALSLAFFVECIRTYMNSEQRLQAGKKLLESTQPLMLGPARPSLEDQRKNKIETVLKAFENFKVDKFYNDYGNFIFRSLVEFGVVKEIQEEDRIKIWKKARAKIINELIAPTTSIDRRNENMRKLKEIKNNPGHESIYTEAMKIMLNKFFTEIVEFEMELSDLIEA